MSPPLFTQLQGGRLKNVVADVETNGLLDDLTTIHCLVVRDMDSDKLVSCADQPGYTPLAVGLQLLSEADKIYGHNFISFDIPAIQKVYPTFRFKSGVRVNDTFIIAGMRWAHIKELDFTRGWKGTKLAQFIGRHSLEAWGHRLGITKGSFGKTTDWSEWSPEMQKYCEQDTFVNKALVLKIRKAGVAPESVDTELRLARFLFDMERNGWPFDMDKATSLQARLAGLKHAAGEELTTMFEPWYVANGKPKVAKKANKKRGIEVGAEYTNIKLVHFNPGSRDHMARVLIKNYDWKPTEYTATGKPKVDEEHLKGMNFPPVKKMREYLLLDKRLGQIAEGKEAWLRHAVNDKPYGGKLTGLYHIHGKIWQNRAVTHRAAHSNPNLGQVPKVDNPWGPECRELFYPGPVGWVQIGADASGLEARCLGHYVAKYDDGAYGKIALAEKPNDIHTMNASILGCPRDKAKTWYYAFLYGAGDEKLGRILYPGEPKAKQKKLGGKDRKKFLKGVVALGLLTKDIAASLQKRDYLKLIDGRRVYIRSEHAALNSLLQGTGAVICKRWIVEFADRLTARFGRQGWNGQWAALGWIHDEVQIAVRKEVADEVAQILVQTMRDLTTHFGFRIPLDGEAKIGANWKECH